MLRRGTRGGGVDETPWVFAMLQCFEKFSPLVKDCDVLYKMKYILWGSALLGATVTLSHVAASLAAILDFNKIENLTGKTGNLLLLFFFWLNIKKCLNKYFTAFLSTFCAFFAK